MAGLAPEQFDALVAPLRDRAAAVGNVACEPETGRVPFLLVVTRQVVPIEQTMPRTTLHRKQKPGFVDRTFEPSSLEWFVAIEQIELPVPNAYLLFDIERGEEFCGAVSKHAMDTIAARGRTLLTIEEGAALISHVPRVLVKNKCFSVGGSRRGAPASRRSGSARTRQNSAGAGKTTRTRGPGWPPRPPAARTGKPSVGSRLGFRRSGPMRTVQATGSSSDMVTGCRCRTCRRIRPHGLKTDSR